MPKPMKKNRDKLMAAKADGRMERGYKSLIRLWSWVRRRDRMLACIRSRGNLDLFFLKEIRER